MVTKSAWLDKGLRALAEGGVGALRIERLTEALGVSKGSFYHHFGDGMPSYQRELLAYFEQQHTLRYIDAVESQDDRTPEEKLRLLRRLVIEDEDDQPQLEASIRSWAAHDGEARRTLERVDATRIDYLRTLWEAISGDPEQALPMARLIYVVLIGSQHVLPPLEPTDIDRLYDIVLGPVTKEQS
jgi:AcrR family transcriptional regulator